MNSVSELKPRGALIVVEGLDRAGKTSQCELLLDAFTKAGHRAKYMKFPDRNTSTGMMINSYLQGKVQQDDHAIHLLFSANRWEAAQDIKSELLDGITVIIDRYSYSGAVYSAAKSNPDLSLEWAWQPEVGLPRPDLLLFLSISTEDAAKRGGYGQERYETSKMQIEVRRLFASLLSLNHGHDIQIIDAGASIELVAKRLLAIAVEMMSERRVPNSLSKIRPWQELQESFPKLP